MYVCLWRRRCKGTPIFDTGKYFTSFSFVFFCLSEIMPIFAPIIDTAMKKELGKWLMDIAKYIATAVLISSFLGGFGQKWIMYLVGVITVILSLLLGLYFINDKK
jgi:cytochrome b subunit of formate dehydrogenase